jgi:cysteine synthase
VAKPPGKKTCDTILDAIGNTPMVRINNITRELVSATVYAKLETFNPGNSTKDRMAVQMIEDAERAGLLKPGGTIVEGTSGNTGMGLAIAGVIKGYRCVFTTTDKQSKEKLDALKAFGAEVIVCPRTSTRRIRVRITRCPRAWRVRSRERGRPTSTATPRIRRRTTSRRDPRSGIRPTAP